MLLYILLFIPLMNAKYIATHVVNTNFKNQSDIVSHFTNPNVYHEYLKIVEATDITFEPNLGNKVNFPFKMIYYNYPNINFFPYKLPKTKIIQIWDRNDLTFIGIIETEFVTIKLTIKPICNQNSKIQLLLQGELEKKKFYVPNSIVNLILTDFEKIFIKINSLKIKL